MSEICIFAKFLQTRTTNLLYMRSDEFYDYSSYIFPFFYRYRQRKQNARKFRLDILQRPQFLAFHLTGHLQYIQVFRVPIGFFTLVHGLNHPIHCYIGCCCLTWDAIINQCGKYEHPKQILFPLYCFDVHHAKALIINVDEKKRRYSFMINFKPLNYNAA